jgi:hypothetical protein
LRKPRFGALAGQLVVASLAGAAYAWYLARLDWRGAVVANANRPVLDPRGWRLILPGVLAALVLFVVLLWPTLFTNYAGHPPAAARLPSVLTMLISFGVCGVGIMLFYGLLVSARSALATTSGASAAERYPLPELYRASRLELFYQSLPGGPLELRRHRNHREWAASK